MPSLNLRVNMAYQLLCFFLASIVVASLGTLRSMPTTNFRRVLPSHGVAGVPLEYHLLIDKPLSSLQAIDLHEEAMPSLEELKRLEPEDRSMNVFDRATGYRRFRRWMERNRVELSAPLSLEHSSLECSLISPRRGLVVLKGIQLLRPDPLGLFRRSRIINGHDEILILPSMIDLPPFQMPSGGRNGRDLESVSSQTGEGQEFHLLRDYRRGDPLKHIHWKSSARTGKLHVKEHLHERSFSYGIVLDTSPAPQNEDFECAVSIAASLLQRLSTPLCHVDLVFVGEQFHNIGAGRGSGAIFPALRSLALCQEKEDPEGQELRKGLLPLLPELTALIYIATSWGGDQERWVREFESHDLPHIILNVSSYPNETSHPRRIGVRPDKAKQDLLALARVS